MTVDPGWDPARLTQAAETDPDAGHRLALLSALGLGTPYDPQRGLALLRRAAEQGHRLALDSLAVLEAEGRSIPDWLSPPPARRVSATPHVLIAEGFVGPPVCDWMRRRAEARLAPAQVHDPRTGEGVRDGVRTNDAAVFDLPDADLVQVLVRERIARLAGLPVAGMEPVQVLRYRPSQAFDWHVDYLDPASPGHREQLARQGQRTATCLIWLNDDYEGGETAFQATGARHRGRKGDAILWANVTPDGRPAPATRHAGLSPTSGEKWILSQWIRTPPPG